METFSHLVDIASEIKPCGYILFYLNYYCIYLKIQISLIVFPFRYFCLVDENEKTLTLAQYK